MEYFGLQKEDRVQLSTKTFFSQGLLEMGEVASQSVSGVSVTVDRSPLPVEETPSLYDDILGENPRAWMDFEV